MTDTVPAAQALMGKTVAILGGAMYAQYRTVKAADALLLHADATSADGASCFVNPLTALGMVETMRREGHKALVHTAAASNLGQMLVKICLKDGVDLVNIVRSPEQAKILQGIGAKHVLDSTSPSFIDDLTDALAETGATIAFDAIGGGKLAGQILGPWRPRPTAPRAPTAGTARPRSSSSTSTAASTPASPSSAAISG
jgi:NADPH:quinone reductase-like Zn-dependent oxidoreductase